MWQEFSRNGERLANGGRLPEKRNPRSNKEDVYTGTIILWLYRKTEQGMEVLFQKRSPYVDGNPNKWDVSAGGHVDYNESVIDAVAREAREEIGAEIDKDALKYAFSLAGSTGQNLFANVYFCDWAGRKDEFHFDDNEVSEVKWVPLAEFDDFVKRNAKDSLQKAKYTLELTKYWLNYYGNL